MNCRIKSFVKAAWRQREWVSARLAAGLACLVLGHALLSSPATAQTLGIRTSNFTYYSNGVLQTETVEPDDPNLCVRTEHGLDPWGNRSSSTTANCTGANSDAQFAPRTSSLSYGSATVTIKAGVGSAEPRDVTLVLPAGQFATEATNAKSQREQRLYDPRFGSVVSVTGPNALTTRWEYDDFGRKVKEIRADGTSTWLTYCILPNSLGVETNSNVSAACNSWLSSSSEGVGAISFIQVDSLDANGAKMGPTSRTYQDRQGRTIRELSEAFDKGQQPTDRRFVAKDTYYNAYGVAYLVTAPYFFGTDSSTVTGRNDMGMTLTTVDALGRPIKVEVADPLGNAGLLPFGDRGTRVAARTEIKYQGHTTVTTNPQQQTRTEEKNAQGQLVRVTDAWGAQLAHRYDPFGNLVETRDALQHTITLSYDVRGRKTGMSDPDTGVWKYVYNALGELVRQQSPKQIAASTTTIMVYDELGRMTSRAEPEYTSTWTYDSCAKGVGKLCQSSTANGVNKTVTYDALGRPESSRTTITNGPTFVTALGYDGATGRVKTQTYPTGVKVQYVYATRGFLTELQLATAATVNPLPATPGGAPAAAKSLSAGTSLWAAGTVNAWGKAESQSLNNGVTSRATFDPNTGRLDTLNAAGPGGNVLDHKYVWDSLNNLHERHDHIGDGNTGGVKESFDYDRINRLTAYTVEAPQLPNLQRTVALHYNAAGSLLYKSDVGNYAYPQAGSPQPHAVSRIVGGSSFGTVDYRYDANGNMYSASGGKYRSVTYNSFNLPDSMAGPGGTVTYAWLYDESHQRIKETHTNASGTRVTWYQHPDNRGGLAFEREESPSGTASNRHYVSAGGQTIVLVSTGALPPTLNTPPAVFVKVEYWHKDHLGSLVATTDHLGNVTARYAYDPFGKRRMTNGSYDASGNLVIDWADNVNAGTDRGYTGHEHLDDIGVVHMNGRIFDPTIARFMQADPFIQAPDELQSYDRFAYCFGNPGACTDPTGYFSLKKFFKSALTIVVAIYAPYLLQTFATYVGFTGVTFATGITATSIGTATFAGAATSGFIAGAISGGSLQSGLQGAFSAGAFYGVGNLIEGGAFFSNSTPGTGMAGVGGSKIAAVAMHGVAGCVTTVAAGGKCGPGALSAAFSKTLAVNGMMKADHLIEGTLKAAVAGGIGSMLGGGKFANGAETGAFSYLFNQAAHALKDPESINGKSFANAKGNTECVEVAKQCLAAPPTRTWVAGESVVGSDRIEKGTLIATFVDGKYQGHAAIYLSQDSNGNMQVLDQWNAQGKVLERTIRNDPKRSFVNNAANYKVVKW